MQDNQKRAPYIRRFTGLWIGIALAIATIVGLAFYQTWPLLFPEVAEAAPLDASCDLRTRPCTAVFPGGGSLSFSIEPRSLPLMKPLRLNIEAEGLDVDSVEVDFSGVNMNMGYNRVQLSSSTDSALVTATGQAVLPVCVRNRMAWEAKVMLQTERGLLVAPFRFDTYRTPPPAEDLR